MDGALAKLPATRWDRLVAVLEENEPERAIDAPHILERAKKLNMSDLELFYLLLMRYQDKQPEILSDVVSLYAMMSTWVEWIVAVQHCLDARKGKPDYAGGNGSVRPATCGPAPGCEPNDLNVSLRSRSSSNYTASPLSSNPNEGSLSYTANGTGGGGGGGGGARSDSATRCSRNRGTSNVRGSRGRSGRGAAAAHHHWCFDLGPDWKWDGSLDFLRNGRVLSNLVEEALDHSGKFEVLQDDHRAHPESLNRNTYDILYPSLADMDRGGGKDSAAVDGSGGNSKDGSFDPVNYLSTFTTSRLSRSRRGKVPPSKALKMIEQQGKNLAAAEQWVRKLNGMCEHFLGWEKSSHKNRALFDLCNPDHLVRPLNSDDARLLYRMHWLAVALYRVVKDPSIIPAPPRMSFIVCRDAVTGFLDTSEEDNEIGLLIATKCSCLPLKTRLSVTMKDFNTIQLFHPDMKRGPRVLPCTVVNGEVYAYFEEYHAFLPVWSVFQYYIKHFDGLTWCFEMNRQEREQERQVLGTNSSSLRTAYESSGDMGPGSSGATFDLTVQSSTVRHGRSRRAGDSAGTPQVMHVSPTSSARHSSPARDTSATPPLPLPPPPHSPEQHTLEAAERMSEMVAAAIASAASTVRRGRVALPLPCASLNGALSPVKSPHLEPLSGRPPVVPSPKGVGLSRPATATPAPVCGTPASGPVAAQTACSSSDATVFTVTSPTSDSAPSLPVSRQATVAGTTADALDATMSLLPLSLTLRLASTGVPNRGEGDAAAVPIPVTRVAAKECEIVESERIVGAAVNEGAMVMPSCTISCSPTSQVMVTRESHLHGGGLEELDYEEDVVSEATTTMMCSESHKIIRNFTASVLLESGQSGIAILSHHFRVSSGPIGKGAFGAVYRALNLDTGRIVAVKQSRYSYDDKTTDLNWREFQMWSMLPPHANVIIFYGASKEVDTHQLLLVMEYASGGSIVQLYRHFRPIPEPLFYDHACGMARGLKHLHDHNVIHGDVKPENVLTRSDGSVAISDFGCSRFSLGSSESDSSSLRSTKRESGSWQLFGTAAYMAPEVILNEPHLKSDVWAYACTLMQLWLGQSPWSGGLRRFSAQDSIPLMFYIANEEVVPFTAEQLERAPWWLQRIAQRAFERDVERRCTMAEVISILTEYSRAYCA